MISSQSEDGIVITEDKKKLTIRVGEHDFKTHLESQHQDYGIKRIILYPEHNLRTLSQDLAIIIIQEAIHFTSVIRPVCLYFSKDNLDGRFIISSGKI